MALHLHLDPPKVLGLCGRVGLLTSLVCKQGRAPAGAEIKARLPDKHWVMLALGCSRSCTERTLHSMAMHLLVAVVSLTLSDLGSLLVANAYQTHQVAIWPAAACFAPLGEKS